MMNPWGTYICDIVEQEHDEVPGVYAEYHDRQLVAMGSTLNLKKTIQEKRMAQSNNPKTIVFHEIVNLNFCFDYADDTAEFRGDFLLYCTGVLSHAGRVKTDHDLSLVRALEGILCQTIAHTREASFKRLQEMLE